MAKAQWPTKSQGSNPNGMPNPESSKPVRRVPQVAVLRDLCGTNAQVSKCRGDTSGSIAFALLYNRGLIWSHFMRRVVFLIAVLVLGVMARAESITVSAAVSLKEALSEIGKTYEKQGGDHVDFNFAASGPLASQIEQGAPVDAFISAANKQVDQLIKSGLADSASRQVVVRNEIVLIAPTAASDPPKSFGDLAGDKVKKIALGQPQSVPAGQYASQTLASMELSDAVTPKLVYGASVRQVLDYVERGEVDAGIVYVTDAKEAGEQVKVMATAEAATHEPIEYPAVVMTQSQHGRAATSFLKFLSSPAAQAVFTSKGFVLPDAGQISPPAP
jgi:molybdate transport system substrate-binding protein